ncbi:MAG: sensor diguanylate cyclase [Frankiales bacterium]|nr:sensor diguanylate cyclase [Frankiales bacterium]
MQVPELQRLARQCDGDPGSALVQVLRLLCEQLGMGLAVLGSVHDGVHTARLVVSAQDGRLRELEGSRPVEDSFCGLVTSGGPLVVRDVADWPDLAAMPVARALAVRCYAGTVVRGTDGQEVGVLGVLGHRPHERLDARDIAVLDGLGQVVGVLYEAVLAGVSSVPRQRSATDLASIAETVGRAQDLEGLTRPLLDALHELSGIASTYLTVVHEAAGVQEIRYSRNAKPGFRLPEGLEVPWGDTLCKRALDEGRSCTTDVPSVWGDAQAAADLGIVTYVSVPVRLNDGRLWGTLCAADDVPHAQAAEQLPTLTLFARLIAAEVERTAVLDRERARADRARYEADTDELTGCSSRRTVRPWLEGALDARRPGEVIVLAFVDVDAFKAVNDTLGHATGDALLATLGSRLLGSARPGDLVARLGGDEFVVGARLPRGTVVSLETRVRLAGCFVLGSDDARVEVRCSTGIASSDDCLDADGLLRSSDAAMYRDKPGARVA